MSTEYGKLNFAVSFNRTSAFPLEANSYFESYDSAVTAAASAVAAGSSDSAYYIGQLITVYTPASDEVEASVALYQIQADGSLLQFGTATTAEGLETLITNVSTRVTTLESAVNNETTGLAATKTIADQGVADAAAAQTTADQAVASAATNATNISGLTTRMGTAESDIDTLQSDVTNLQNSVGDLSGAFQYKGTFDILPATDSYEAGNVVIVGSQEYVLVEADGAKSWVEFGDEGSHLTKTVAAATYVSKENSVNGIKFQDADGNLANITLTGEDIAISSTDGTLISTQLETLQNNIDSANSGWEAAIAALDVTAVSVGAANTISTISETDGKISVTPIAIQIAESQVTGLETDISAIEGRLDTAEADIDALETTVGGLAGIKSVSSEFTLGTDGALSVNAIASSKITGLDTSISSIEADIENLQTEVSSTIDEVQLNGTALTITNQAVNIPLATAAAIGLVKGSTAENQVAVGTDGTMTVNDINANKIVQTAGDTLILDGGTASVTTA